VLARDPADVYVAVRDTSALADAEIAAGIDVLSDDERAQCERFHFAEDARDYAVAHALLRLSLSHGTDRSPSSWRFARTASGKPLLAGADASYASFSLTHTRGMVACAVAADADVGIDIERLDREVDAPAISARFFAPTETAGLARLDERARRERFFDVWTLKESLVKALGLGLAVSIGRFAFDVDGLSAGRAIAVSGPLDAAPHQWQFELFTPAPGFRGAVAIRRRSGPPLRVTIRPFTRQA
jgi:4'-phosphopantetheinyl transferase